MQCASQSQTVQSYVKEAVWKSDSRPPPISPRVPRLGNDSISFDFDGSSMISDTTSSSSSSASNSPDQAPALTPATHSSSSATSSPELSSKPENGTMREGDSLLKQPQVVVRMTFAKSIQSAPPTRSSRNTVPIFSQLDDEDDELAVSPPTTSSTSLTAPSNNNSNNNGTTPISNTNELSVTSNENEPSSSAVNPNNTTAAATTTSTPTTSTLCGNSQPQTKAFEEQCPLPAPVNMCISETTATVEISPNTTVTTAESCSSTKSAKLLKRKSSEKAALPSKKASSSSSSTSKRNSSHKKKDTANTTAEPPVSEPQQLSSPTNKKKSAPRKSLPSTANLSAQPSTIIDSTPNPPKKPSAEQNSKSKAQPSTDSAATETPLSQEPSKTVASPTTTQPDKSAKAASTTKRKPTKQPSQPKPKGRVQSLKDEQQIVHTPPTPALSSTRSPSLSCSSNINITVESDDDESDDDDANSDDDGDVLMKQDSFESEAVSVPPLTHARVEKTPILKAETAFSSKTLISTPPISEKDSTQSSCKFDRSNASSLSSAAPCNNQTHDRRESSPYTTSHRNEEVPSSNHRNNDRSRRTHSRSPSRTRRRSRSRERQSSSSRPSSRGDSTTHSPSRSSPDRSRSSNASGNSTTSRVSPREEVSRSGENRPHKSRQHSDSDQDGDSPVTEASTSNSSSRKQSTSDSSKSSRSTSSSDLKRKHQKEDDDPQLSKRLKSNSGSALPASTQHASPPEPAQPEFINISSLLADAKKLKHVADNLISLHKQGDEEDEDTTKTALDMYIQAGVKFLTAAYGYEVERDDINAKSLYRQTSNFLYWTSTVCEKQGSSDRAAICLTCCAHAAFKSFSIRRAHTWKTEKDVHSHLKRHYQTLSGNSGASLVSSTITQSHSTPLQQAQTSPLPVFSPTTTGVTPSPPQLSGTVAGATSSTTTLTVSAATGGANFSGTELQQKDQLRNDISQSLRLHEELDDAYLAHEAWAKADALLPANLKDPMLMRIPCNLISTNELLRWVERCR